MRKRAVAVGLLSVGLSLFACGTRVRADFQQVEYDYKLSDQPVQTNFDATTPSLLGKNPFQVQLFDPSKFGQPGITPILTGVEINLYYEFDNTRSLRFDSSGTITVNAAGVLHLYAPDGKTDLVNTPTFAPDPVPVTRTVTDGNPVFVTLPMLVVKSVSGKYYNDTAMLDTFTGAGKIPLSAVATATSSVDFGSANGMGRSDTSALVSLAVIYSYAVPEPSSLVLTGSGGLGLLLVWLGRFRRRGVKTA